MDTLLTRMEQIHPDLYHANSQAEWKQAATHLKKRLPDLSYVEAVAGFARLVALAEDGHTSLSPPSGPGFRTFYPVELYLFSDGLYVQKASASHTDLFGKRITQINGVPTGEALDALRPYIPAGNRIWRAHSLPLYLQVPAMHHAVGLSDELQSPLMLTVTGENGEQETVNIKAVSRRSPPEMVSAAGRTEPQATLPLYQRLKGNYAFEYLNREHALYLRYGRVRNEEDESLSAFVERVFAFADSHRVEKFIVDIRDNSGGNNYLNQPLVHSLIRSDEINQPGRLFVITDRGTFSAAMNLATRIERHTHALFVGEPTGAPPNAYGDAERITLPASSLTVAVSDLYWQDSDPRDDRPWIYPDISARLSYDDFATGRDPAMKAILRYDPGDAPEALKGSPNQNWQRPSQKRDWEIVTNR